MKETEVKKVVRERYARVAKRSSPCCAPASSPCCGTSLPETVSRNIGYSDEELKAAPEGANLGLGCGNPVALASLQAGETVLDLGSGAGFDCFLAANKVGKKGKVIGVDMTPEMLERARANARKGKYSNVEFRLGEIENLPVADSSVDAIISNCVINLSPDKRQVFAEAYRVLKPGGRVMVSDLVLLRPLPEAFKNSVEAYTGCIGGAMMKADYISTIKAAGFQDVRIVGETTWTPKFMTSDPMAQAIIKELGLSAAELESLLSCAASVKVHGTRPK